MPWKIIWVTVAIGTIAFGGEILLTLVEEVVELIVDVTQSVFMLLFEKVFELPYDKAQGRAAWTSLGLLIILTLFGAWRLTPWIKRISGEFRQGWRGARNGVVESWHSARWYLKVLYVAGGLVILSGLVLVI